MKTLILDFSQIAHATYFVSIALDHDAKDMMEHEKLNYWKHLMLGSIRKSIVVHKPNEVIIAVDSSSWRKDVFKYYKMRRAARREKSGQDMHQFFETIETFIKELQEHFPFKLVKFDKAEADDVIAVLTDYLYVGRKEIVIVSGDKDFQQLLKYKNVKLFNPSKDSFVACDDPMKYLLVQILRGDDVDDIPNFKSDDDTFINENKRQTACGEKGVEKILSEGLDEYLNDPKNAQYKKNFERNRQLISLTSEFIPDFVVKGIIDKYNSITHSQREQVKSGKPIMSHTKMSMYFGRNKMKSQLDSVHEFCYDIII